MKTTTESDIPQLFRQFSGNSANYQELTRAAAARASQARWPLLSAVELEQGDIPAVVDRETGLTVLETKPRAAGDPATPDPGGAEAVPFAVLTEIIPDAVPTAGEIIAQAQDEGVSLSKDELLALVDIGAHQVPEMPVPVIVPGTNTIFMAPAPFSARHFAQVERALAARREAAMGEIPAPADVIDAALPDAPVQADVTESAPDATAQADVTDAAQMSGAVSHSASDAVVEHQAMTAAAPSDDAAHTLAALSAELAAEQPQEAAAPVAEVAKAVTPPAAPLVQAAAVVTAVAVSAPAPKVVDAALPAQVTPAIAAPGLKLSPVTAQTPVPAAQVTPAEPVSAPIFRPSVVAAAPVRPAAPVQPKAAAQAPLRAPAPPAPAPQSLAAASDASPLKHAGLQPLFERLAAPEEAASPVKSLFSRLLQS